MANTTGGRVPEGLAPNEAALVRHALRLHRATPGLDSRTELLLAVAEVCGEKAGDERLDLEYGVGDCAALLRRLDRLSRRELAAILSARGETFESV